MAARTALRGACGPRVGPDGAETAPSGRAGRFKRLSKGLGAGIETAVGAGCPEVPRGGRVNPAAGDAAAQAASPASGVPFPARHRIGARHSHAGSVAPEAGASMKRTHSARNRFPTPEVAAHEVALARCSAFAYAGATVAVAPCFFQVTAQGAATDLVEIQATPAGPFLPRDGRKLPVDAWRIDAAIAARVIERFRANKTPPVVDYEHQTLLADENGLPAPAAGFIRDLEWREGFGLVAKVDLTKRARDYVVGGEYRYFSPVIAYDKNTGEVLELVMGALTNNPAIDGMAPVELRAAARYHLNDSEETKMINKHLLAIALLCAIKTDNQNEDQVGAAVTDAVKQLKAAPDPLAALRQELGLADTMGAEEIKTAVVALKSKATAAAAAGGEPDPAKYVPIAVVTEMRDQLAALSASHTGREVDELVDPAVKDGRLLPAQAQWARDLGKKDIAALKAYLDTAAPIAALRATQTDGQAPAAGTNEHGLTAGELAVCKSTGVDPKDFAAAKAAG